MATLTWYFGRTGNGQVGDIAAHSILDVRALRRTGQSQITVTKGDLDYYINLEDPNGGAMAIEFGTDDTPALSPLRDAVADVAQKGVIL